MKNKKKGLVPPKLNTPFLIMGFTPLESLSILICFVLFGITFSLLFIVLPAILALFLCRIDGETNVLKELIKLYKYYTTPQIFDVKEVKSTYEYIDKNTYN